jgi:hypothetical protein
VEAIVEDKEVNKNIDIKPWFDYNILVKNKRGESLVGS